MPALFPGERPPRLRIDRERIPIPGGSGVRTEILTIMNDGGGILKGSALSDVRWITIPSLRIETPFILPFRIEISPEKIPPGEPGKGVVTLVTNGGSARIIIEFNPCPEPKPVLSLDNRYLQFCNLRKGEDFSFDLTLRNTGSGLLNGTIESGSDWIEVKTRTIWTRDIQAIPIVIHTSAAPMVRQPIGRIRIQSSGGNQDITIPIHFRGGKGPRLRLDPPRIKCTWEKRGTFESTLTIHNEGEGILRGTIPSPVPWLKFIPSIFPVEKSEKIRLKIDTRQLPGGGTLSIPVPIITNAGTDTLIVEVTPGRRTGNATPIRRARPSRYLHRTRLIAYGPDGEGYTLISTGKSGGEGEIFQVSGDESRCAKIFHPHRRTGEIEEKLQVMVRNPPPDDLQSALTWPLALLTDLPGGGKVIGYLMRLIPVEEYKPAHLWYDKPGFRDKDGMKCSLTLALALARVVTGIHGSGHSIGDLRENNLLIDKTGNLVLIDTDSFQIRDPVKKKIFWSRVGTGEYLPPEHLDGSFAGEGCDRRFGDHFALAILIFRFLMDGVHPFQAKGPLVQDAPATIDKIQLGHFAFESHLAGISPPDYAPSYNTIPSPVKTLFREAFVLGHQRPSVRPDAGRWMAVLSRLIPLDQESCRKEKTAGSNQISQQRIDTRIILTESRDANLPHVRVYRTSQGSIIRSSREKTQVFLPDTGIRIPGMEVLPTPHAPMPPSLVIPFGIVYRDRNIPAGWMIPEIEPSRYLPWHMIADPESRSRSGRTGFSFRHRVACCRNLMAALISAREMNLPGLLISERSVFVAPDSSIRILCIPFDNSDESADDVQRYSIPSSVLIFRMLMDGYHPFHATGRRTKGLRSPEKRMEAGLYPWEGSDPWLMPPPGAPSPDILPKDIRDLFNSVFNRGMHDESEEHNCQGSVNPEIWFAVFDRVLSGLISCTKNPDHWYLPSAGGCPWCSALERIPEIVRGGGVFFLRPGTVPLRIAGPVIAGFLMIPRRFRRRWPKEPVSTRWTVIPLPAVWVVHLPLPLSRIIPVLPERKSGGILLIPWQRQWLAGIPEKPLFTPVREPGSPDNDFLPPMQGETSESVQIFMNEISLIDEMIWVSTMDRIRGEGIGLPGKQRITKPRQIALRRRPVQFMLLPLNIPLPDEPVPLEEMGVTKPRGEKNIARKKGSGKGIRGRLQCMLRDFFDAAAEDA